jgi:hypothetical protein
MSRKNEVKCDGCGHDLPPDGPRLVLDYESIQGHELAGPRDFCGISCLKQYLSKAFPETGDLGRKRA